MPDDANPYKESGAHTGQAVLPMRPDYLPKEDCISPDLLALEESKLFPRVWQTARRLEEHPNIGDFVTYDIYDDSILVLGTGADEIKDGDVATARTTMQEIMRGPDGAGMQMWGTHYDDLVRTDAGWRFKLRRFRTAIFEAKPPAGDVFRSFGDIA